MNKIKCVSYVMINVKQNKYVARIKNQLYVLILTERRKKK